MSPTAPTDNPLIVQSDRSILLEVDNSRYGEARDALAAFAELEKSPEHIHTYRITPLSVWNACAAGHPGDGIVATIRALSKYPPPQHVLTEIADFASRYGRLRLLREGDSLLLACEDSALCEELAGHEKLRGLLSLRLDDLTFRVAP